jgi:outer membrane protein assembly factor BamD (BamD/ComL family)
MKREEYIRYLKQLIKKYHPDLCKDEYLEKVYNEITIILNNKLNKIKERNNPNENTVFENYDEINLSGNNYLIKIKNQDYECYKLGIKYYRNIHPNQCYKRNDDKTYEPKIYEEQLKIVNRILLSFNSAEYYFKKVIMEYPKSEWANDSKEKIKLLKKLYKSYENMNVEENNRIIDVNKFVEEVGIRVM